MPAMLMSDDDTEKMRFIRRPPRESPIKSSAPIIDHWHDHLP
jgi:hypothetical protein